MGTSDRPMRQWLTVALALSVAGLVAACSANGTSGTTGPTVTATAPPTSQTSSPSGGTTSPSPSSTPAGPAECATTALRVSVRPGGAAAGTGYVYIDFTNTGGATCLMAGYPGVSLVSAGSNAGSQIGSDAKRNSVRPDAQITLAPGQTANAQLGIADAGNFPAASCQPVTAHWMKVFPPDQFTATYVKFSVQTCASTSVHTMFVSTIGAGA